MTRSCLTVLVLVALSLAVVACGRKGTLDRPDGDPNYPRAYPAPIDQNAAAS